MSGPTLPQSRKGATALLRQLRRAPSSSSTHSRTACPRIAAALPSRTSPKSSSPVRFSSSTSSSSSSNYSSVNADEVSHFNALASEWWDPNGSSRLLHLMNPLRHDFIRSCRASSSTSTAGSPPAQDGLRYLDVGCGGGIFAESAARLPTTASVTAIDPTPGVLAIARSHARRDPFLNEPRLRYLPATIENLPLPTSSAEQFDVVSVFEVVEHVEDPAGFLARAAPFVKPGGWLVGSTIAKTFVSWFTTNFIAEDVLGIVPKGTHDWNKYINEHVLRQWVMQQGGWSSPRAMGVIYVPGLGWKSVEGSEKVGNYFFAFRRDPDVNERGN